MTNRIIKISNEEIQSALSETTRQYLVGHLQRPQTLSHINDKKIEIGITSYQSHSSELPHTHSQAYEYQYMISGYTRYLDIDTKEEFAFKKGDFYMISPGMRYAQKSKPGTTILFIKIPPGNDKIDIQPDSELLSWLKDKITTIRQDYTDDPNAPLANSIKPAAAVALFNKDNKVLVIRRRDSGNWTLPGGTLEYGEDLTACAKRELKEETGYDVKIVDLIGTYTSPKTVVEYSDGEVRQEFTILYKGEIVAGDLKIDEESTAYRWMSLEDVLKEQLAESQRQRIKDVIEYQRSGKKSFR